MKIYEVEYRNTRYSGQSNVSQEVVGRNVKDAVERANAYAKKDDDRFFGFRNWEVIAVRLISEPVNG